MVETPFRSGLTPARLVSAGSAPVRPAVPLVSPDAPPVSPDAPPVAPDRLLVRPDRPPVAEPAEPISAPTTGTWPSRPCSRATRAPSSPVGAATGRAGTPGAGSAGTGNVGAGGSAGTGGVGSVGAGPAVACGAETMVSEAFAASAGAATKAALAKTLADATPPRMIRRFFTTHSIPTWGGEFTLVTARPLTLNTVCNYPIAIRTQTTDLRKRRAQWLASPRIRRIEQ